MKLSKRLSTLRKTSKASLQAVSRRCNCSPQYLHRLEKGVAHRPAIELLYKLAAYYQFPSDTLIIEAEKIPSDVYWAIVHNPKFLQTVRGMMTEATLVG